MTFGLMSSFKSWLIPTLQEHWWKTSVYLGFVFSWFLAFVFQQIYCSRNVWTVLGTRAHTGITTWVGIRGHSVHGHDGVRGLESVYLISCVYKGFRQDLIPRWYMHPPGESVHCESLHQTCMYWWHLLSLSYIYRPGEYSTATPTQFIARLAVNTGKARVHVCTSLQWIGLVSVV